MIRAARSITRYLWACRLWSVQRIYECSAWRIRLRALCREEQRSTHGKPSGEAYFRLAVYTTTLRCDDGCTATCGRSQMTALGADVLCHGSHPVESSRPTWPHCACYRYLTGRPPKASEYKGQPRTVVNASMIVACTGEAPGHRKVGASPRTPAAARSPRRRGQSLLEARHP